MASPRKDRYDPFRIIVPDGDPGSLRSHAVRFLEDTLVRAFSERTAHGHAHNLWHFFKWCDERDIARPAEVTLPILLRHQRWLFHYRKRNGKALNSSTQRQRIVTLRVFFAWLAKRGHLPSNPAADLELPRQEHRLPRSVLSIEEAERVLAQPNLRTRIGLRDRAILETFYSTGLRRKEVCGLLVADCDRARGVVLVRLGKGSKDRYVPLGERASFWIGRYLAEVRPSLVRSPDNGFLFLTLQGQPMLEHPLGATVKAYLGAAGIDGRGCCHLFRHSCATAMLQGGADIRYIQQMLGHVSLESTAVYTKVAIEKLREVHAATHPGARGRLPTR